MPVSLLNTILQMFGKIFYAVFLAVRTHPRYEAESLTFE